MHHRVLLTPLGHLANDLQVFVSLSWGQGVETSRSNLRYVLLCQYPVVVAHQHFVNEDAQRLIRLPVDDAAAKQNEGQCEYGQCGSGTLHSINLSTSASTNLS